MLHLVVYLLPFWCLTSRKGERVRSSEKLEIRPFRPDGRPARERMR